MDIAEQTRNQLMGVEFDWLLQDRDGHLALCQTAGFGDVPRSVLDRGHPALEADGLRLESLVSVLPVTGGYRPWWSRTAHDPLSRELARRGLHVYVWTSHRGPYRRKLRPERPVRLADIATAAPGLAAAVPRLDLLFPRTRWFQLSRHLPSLRLHGDQDG